MLSIRELKSEQTFARRYNYESVLRTTPHSCRMWGRKSMHDSNLPSTRLPDRAGAERPRRYPARERDGVCRLLNGPIGRGCAEDRRRMPQVTR